MKNIILAATAGAIAATGTFAVPAEAGPFDRLKRKVQKVEREVRKVEQTVREVEQAVDTVEAVADGDVSAEAVAGAVVNGTAGRTRLGSPIRGVRGMNGAVPGGRNYPKTATGPGHAGRAGPAPAKFTKLTKCADVNISNAMIGKMGRYSFQDGLTTEERTGLIDRQQVTPVKDCIMPSMGTYDVLYMEIPTSQVKAMQYSMKMQCVDQATGKNANSAAFPRWSNVKGKDIMLDTGNSLGYTPTHSGSISDRSGAWDADLKRRGMTMFGFNMPNLHTDAGTDFYCQYYDTKSGKSVAAFSYRRSAG